MKKFILCIAILASAILFGSCTKEYFIDDSTTIIGANLTVLEYSVKANQWQIDEEGGYFYVSLSVPQITKEVSDKGAVQVTRKYNDNGTIYWSPLPIVIPNSEPDDQGEGNYYYSLYIDYEWTIGELNIFVTATDFWTGDTPTAMDFRVNIFEN